MKIYLSSSWKNRGRVRAMAEVLRAARFEVYDFTDPKCRTTPELPPERYPESFDPEKHVYADYLRAHAEWEDAVKGNREAIDDCDVVLLLLPCGADAHADWAYGVGRCKITVVVGHPPAGERTPTHLWADMLLNQDEDVVPWLKTRLPYPRCTMVRVGGSSTPWHCPDCGSNVQTETAPKRYTCNGCGSKWAGDA